MLTCDVECCDGDNCNHPNFTGKYPMTWTRRLTSDAYGNVSLYTIYNILVRNELYIKKPKGLNMKLCEL